MENLTVYCLQYAQSGLPESMVFDGGAAEKKIPISFAVYLIQTGSRKIMIDAGCDTMPGFVMENFSSPAAVLEQVSVACEEITDVIITHAHHDHIEGVKHFKNATIHITKAEYEAGKPYIPRNMKVNVFEKEMAVNPQIKVMEWGGHAKASAIVEVKAGGKTHIFAGDECYTNANIEQNCCTGAFYNKEKAAAFVEKFRDEKYCVHTSHDISLKTQRVV